MSCRQCCAWSCHNRKGRCPEDIKGVRVCSCPSLCHTDCPKSGELLSLHYIKKMPDNVKRAVVSKINQTRKGPKGTNWKPTAESCICNMHYEHFKGPTRSSNIILPQYFKRPHEFPVPSPKRKTLVCSQQIFGGEPSAIEEQDSVSKAVDNTNES